MRNTRIYQAQTLSANTLIRLDEPASHYVRHVLRLTPHVPVILFNGQGGEYPGEIVQLERRAVWVQLKDFIAIERESPLLTHLVQSIVRSNKMDLIIQKAVELGVSRITPLMAARCNIQLEPKRFAKRMHHWQQIIIHAAEQCGRNRLPLLSPMIAFADWVNAAAPESTLLLHPTGSLHVSQVTPPSSRAEITIAVGPEGGFSAEELALANARNLPCVQLGPRILRTETAGLCALSIVQSRCGDL